LPLDEKNAAVIAIGSDHAGFGIKGDFIAYLEGMGYRPMDFGTHSGASCDYPDMALEVAEAVAEGRASRGVLVCGTGVGMAMVANKVPGIRAAVCNDEYCARYSRLHNDANVLTLGARVVDTERARLILRTFLETEFEGKGERGERHVRRLDKLAAVEKKYLKT
jgi:ribose 5-phosphate isomerase B